MNKTKSSRKNSSQMIILMGIILAIAIFVVSGISADIINLDVVISNERAALLSPEFDYIKDNFGTSLNYNLIDNVEVEVNINNLTFKGNINNITSAFIKTRNEFTALELRYGNFFDADLNKCWYSHRDDEKHVYYVSINLVLEDEKTRIDEDVLYAIVCEF